MNPLKPCPFCLTDGDERLIELWDTFDAGHIAHIHCTHCGADGPSVYGEMGAAPTIARARSMWNGRAEYLKTPNAELTGRPARGGPLERPVRPHREGLGMSIVTTRAQRRELERQNAKMPRELRPVPREEWPLEHQRGPIQRVWRSRDFLVQEYSEPAPVLVRLSVLRTTLDPKAGRWVDGITWDELQQIKAECGYADHDALELYPMAANVVNVANLRHLWVMREPVAFAWRSGRQ